MGVVLGLFMIGFLMFVCFDLVLFIYDVIILLDDLLLFVFVVIVLDNVECDFFYLYGFVDSVV